MDIVIKRLYFEDATIGHLFIAGQDNPVLFTIEKPDKDNQVKISCIPEGVYNVVPYTSDKLGEVWEVKDVKDRTAILIHAANWEHELQGCIGVGMGAGYIHYHGVAKKAVYSSRNAVSQLKEITGYKPFKLHIRS